MKNLLKFLYPTLILAAICLIVSLALSSANAVTVDRIAKLEAEKTEKAMSRVLEAETYTEKTVEKDGKELIYYEACDGDTVKGFIFITSANGYGGEVKVMTAISEGIPRSIKAVEILDVSSETPGLGQNATNEEFYGQFAEKSAAMTAVKSGTAKNTDEINAITGATITSRAVTKAVNEALALCEQIKTEVGTNE